MLVYIHIYVMKLTQPDPQVAIAASNLNLANMCFQFLRPIYMELRTRVPGGWSQVRGQGLVSLDQFHARKLSDWIVWYHP